jgi:hypothetical protein
VSPAIGALLRRLLSLFLVLACSLGAPALAGAADAPDSAPSDAPMVTAADSISLPPLPEGYQVEHLGWWTLAYPASVHERVAPLIEKAAEWRSELATDFGQDVLTVPIEVRVGRSWNDMTRLVPKGVGVPAYASGVTYGGLRLVLLSLTEPTGAEPTDLETVLHHELSHVALADAVAGRRVPRWFNEGLAVYESGELPWARMRTLWDAALFRQLLPLSDLDRSFSDRSATVNVAYAESADVVRFLLHGKDGARFLRLIAYVRDGAPFERALADAYGTDIRRLEFEWREQCAKRNTFAPVLASGSFVWVLAFAALVVGYRRRRHDHQATLDRWAREERQEAAIRATVVEEEAPFADPPRVAADLPRIEHDGGWHTVH